MASGRMGHLLGGGWVNGGWVKSVFQKCFLQKCFLQEVFVAHILIVEDDFSIGQSIVAFVCACGHTTEIALEGFQALKLLATGTHFDLVITDNQMEGMAGIEFIKNYRQLGYKQEIIMMTANHKLACDANYIIMKPFDIACFLATIEIALEHNSLAA